MPGVQQAALLPGGGLGVLASPLQNLIQMQQVRHRQTKHWKPEFKRLRKLKFVKMDLPNLREKQEDITMRRCAAG